jgi:hypothetical protein
MTTSSKTPKSLLQKVKPMVTKVLKEEMGDEEWLIYEVGVSTFPDPTALALSDGDSAEPSAVVSIIPVIVVYLEIPGAKDGTSMYAAPILVPFQVTVDEVRERLQATLADMRDRREKSLADEESVE